MTKTKLKKMNFEEAVEEMNRTYDDISDRDRLVDIAKNALDEGNYGVAENLYGWDEICAFRQQRANQGGAPQRRITRRALTTYGEDFGTANIEYVRDSGKSGRQSQTWMRTPEGWRVVAAHVSMLAPADNDPGSKPRAS